MRVVILSSILALGAFSSAPAWAASCCEHGLSHQNGSVQTTGSSTVSVERGVTVIRPSSTIDLGRAERIASQELKYKARQDYLNYAADQNAANRDLQRERLNAQQESQERNLNSLNTQSRNANIGNYYGRNTGLYYDRTGGYYARGY